MWAIGGVCTAGFVISFIRDPRRLRNGVLLLLAVLAVLAAAVSTPGPVDDGVRATVLSLIVVVGLLGYLALVVFLLANGVLVIRREGRSVALALPLATAIVLIAIPAIVVWGISKNGTPGGFFAVLPALLALGVAGYLGFVLLSFVTYGALYRMRTRTPSSGAVLILGSRIFDGKVPPLLAARLNPRSRCSVNARPGVCNLPSWCAAADRGRTRAAPRPPRWPTTSSSRACRRRSCTVRRSPPPRGRTSCSGRRSRRRCGRVSSC